MLTPRDYVLYLRKSKGRAGITRQRTETTRVIEEHGGRVVAEFVDVDTTAYAKPGQRARRDDYTRMLAFLRGDERSVPLGIGAWHTDRLNRSTADADDLINVAAAGRHVVLTARAGIYDLSTATGRKRFRQDAVDAAFEVDHMTERIEAAKVEAAAEGEWLGGRRPFGFKADGVRHKRAEARAIDTATDAVLSGVPLEQIRRDWAAAGLTGTSGGELTGTAVRRILLRPRNAGLMEHRGRVVGRARWLPVLCAERYRPAKGARLDPDTEEAWRAEAEARWRALVGLLTDPGRRTSPGPERRWLGSGLYGCGYPDGEGGVCGLPMTTGQATKPRKRTVYRCSGEEAHVVRDALVLDAYVSAAVCERLARPDAAGLLAGGSDVDAARLHVEIKALQERLEELADMFAAGDIDGPQMRRGSAKLREEIAEHEGVLAGMVQSSALEGIAGREDAAEVWEGLDLHRRRAIVGAVLEVTILPAPRGRPRGHVAGMPYFHPEAVRMVWRG